MNKPDLIELIEYLESEKESLDNQQKDCLNQYDYKGAHHLSIAIGEVNRQLRILYNLNDPLYEEKKRLENYKLIFDTPIKGMESEHLNEVYVKRKKEIDEQIDQLNKSVKDKKLDGQEFDDAIYELIEQKISGFKFHFKRKENCFLDFKFYDSETIIVSTNPLDQLENGYSMTYLKGRFNALGFTFNNNLGCMEFLYNIKRFKNSIEIKILTSRIIFDILYYKELDNPAIIEKY